MKALTSRRALLRAGAAAAVVLPGTPTADADLAVIAARAYVAAHQRWLEAERHTDAVMDRAAEHYPDVPEDIRIPREVAVPGRDPYFAMAPAQVRSYAGSREDAERKLALIAAYEAERNKVLARFGHPEAEAASNTANEETHRLMATLRRTPATTMAGVLAKMRLAADFDGFEETAADPDNTFVAPMLLASVLADLERLAGAETTALSGCERGACT